MKKIFFTIISVMIFEIGFAQQNANPQIPQHVITGFSEKFPSASVKNWKKINTEYAAEFFIEKTKYIAFYSADANWLRTERKIKSPNLLPEMVKKNFHKSEYAGWRINEIKEIETPQAYSYFLNVDNTNHMAAEKPHSFKEHLFLYFSKTGELVKKEKVNDNHPQN